MSTTSHPLGRMFPIMASKMFVAIPWEVIAHCEEQAQRNHMQSLTRLAERGGLSPCEAVALLEGKRYHDRWPERHTEAQGREAELSLLSFVASYLL